MTVPSPLAVAMVAAVAGGTVGAVTRGWVASLVRGGHLSMRCCVAGTGGLWALTAAAWSAGAVRGVAVPLLLGLGWLAVTASLVDLTFRRLPDALTLPAVPAVPVLLAPLGTDAVLRGVAGAVVLVAAHAAVRLAAPSAMGGGDVKLAGSVGAALGGVSWSAVVVGTVAAAVLTGVSGAVARVAAGRVPPARCGGGPDGEACRCGPRRGTSAPAGTAAGAVARCVPRPRVVPHGPSMVVASLVTVAAAAWASATGSG